MATFAQIVDGQALNVIMGTDVEGALAQHFAPGFDGGHPGVSWQSVPDGTRSGWSVAQDDDGNVTGSSAPIVIPDPKPTIIPAIDFIKRMTLLERAGVLGSADNIVKAFQFELQKVDNVNLSDPDTIAGVNYLETPAGLLAAGRAAEILTP